jgi:hypothetical protein
MVSEGWVHVFYPHVLLENIIMAGVFGRGGFSPHGRPKKREKEGDWSLGITFRVMLPVTYFLQ